VDLEIKLKVESIDLHSNGCYLKGDALDGVGNPQLYLTVVIMLATQGTNNRIWITGPVKTTLCS